MTETTRYLFRASAAQAALPDARNVQSGDRKPLRWEEQDDGRIHHWGAVALPNEAEARILRVVTLEDGATIHNAFLDRNFREDAP